MDHSFWSGGFDFGNSSSAIDELLAQPDFTLEDLLTHEDIIQECKYLNTDLIDYLSHPNVIQKLVQYVITPPLSPEDESKMDPDEVIQIKSYAYTASELFACEAAEMLDALFDNPSLLELLFSFLDQPPGIDPGSCAYFCKVVVVLIGQKHGQLVNFIQETNQLEKILTHIGLYSVMELLIRIGWDDGGGPDELGFTPENIDPEWLHKADLVQMLVSRLDPKYDDQYGVHVNAACCLVDVVVKSSPLVPSVARLVDDLQSEKVLKQVFNLMFCGSISSLTNTLSIAIVLVQADVERRREQMGQDMEDMGGDLTQDQSELNPEEKKTIDDKLSPILIHVIEVLPKLMEYLRKPTELDGTTLKTQYGELNPPFGSTRLRIVELMLALVTSELFEVYDALVKHNVLLGVFEMFFAFHWNNMLHGVVESMILTILGNSTIEEVGEDGTTRIVYQDEHEGTDSIVARTELYTILKKNLFQSAFLVRHICSAFARNAEAQKATKGFRLGYMGHLLRIGVAITSCCSDSNLKEWGVPQEDIEAWNALKEGQLAHDVEEQETVLGGYRPGEMEEEEEDDDLVETLQFGDVSLDDQVDENELYEWENTIDTNDPLDALGGDNSSDDSDDDPPISTGYVHDHYSTEDPISTDETNVMDYEVVPDLEL